MYWQSLVWLGIGVHVRRDYSVCYAKIYVDVGILAVHKGVREDIYKSGGVRS